MPSQLKSAHSLPRPDSQKGIWGLIDLRCISQLLINPQPLFEPQHLRGSEICASDPWHEGAGYVGVELAAGLREARLGDTPGPGRGFSKENPFGTRGTRGKEENWSKESPCLAGRKSISWGAEKRRTPAIPKL